MKIKLSQFEGPLDLLLRLIEEQKLNITEIALAEVTEQFLKYLRESKDLRPHQLADWLAVAAKLLVIKSKVLIPQLELSEEEEEEASNLAWQLYQYKCYKEAAKLLAKLDAKKKQGFSRHASFTEKITFFPDPALDQSVLLAAMKSIKQALASFIKVPKKILEEVVTISEKIEHLQTTIHSKVETKLKDLLGGAKSKTEVIVTFLALLELVKQQILHADQEAIFSDIVIRKQD